MALRSDSYVLLTILCVLLFCMPGNGVYAFGAGNIPNFAFLEGRAFRHGDIEDTLAELVKRTAAGLSIGALVGKAGPNFGNLDIKRVYFGNWLRDYSQAMDVAALRRMQTQTIMNLIMVLSFLAHGYATNEFEVTPERLGVYLPVEHIDNPRGYFPNARQFHPGLRGPVDPRELEVDLRTGMKNYIGNENGTWDTSKGFIRRTLERCIQIGRTHRTSGLKQDEYEAFRLLGQALHTLEDFPAHSNFCELALVSMGYQNVFVHVGDQVRIQAPNGRWVAPLVTGTFGSDDFFHSLLGEASDHISQSSVVDLNEEINKAKKKKSKNGSSDGGLAGALRALMTGLPSSDGKELEQEMQGMERIRVQATQPGGKKPEDMNPQELHSVLWEVLCFRDRVVKKITKTIDMIPGLRPLLDNFSDSVSVFVFTTLEPFLRPIMNQATSELSAASSEVIASHDQYEVFNDPRASDPTHSFLSKDHFNLILNEPAGGLGKVILIHTVKLVVMAWDNPTVNVHQVTEEILECMFHPDFFDQRSKVQFAMLQYLRTWVQSLGKQQKEVIHRLSKDVVRTHGNIRLAGQGGPASTEHGAAQQAGHQAQHDFLEYIGLGKLAGDGKKHDGKHGKDDKKDDKDKKKHDKDDGKDEKKKKDDKGKDKDDEKKKKKDDKGKKDDKDKDKKKHGEDDKKHGKADSEDYAPPSSFPSQPSFPGYAGASSTYTPSYTPSYPQPAASSAAGYEPSYQAPLDPFGLQNFMSSMPQYQPPTGHHGFFGGSEPSYDANPPPLDAFNFSNMLGQLTDLPQPQGSAYGSRGQPTDRGFKLPSPDF